MNVFTRRDGVLFAEEVSCDELVQQFDSPLFVYSRSAIEASWKTISESLQQCDHLICYAVKANSNLGVLQILAELGSGFDIVSAGELERVLAAGGKPENIVFSGVGKKAAEMQRALEVGIRCFNVESESELHRLADVAQQLGVVAPVSLRINPDVDAKTHPYISTGLKENKFGITIPQAMPLYRWANAHKHLSVQGIDCHIGSQLTEIKPYTDALERLLVMVDQLAEEGIQLHHIDVGGGQGICYKDEDTLDFGDLSSMIMAALGDRSLQLVVEPGRFVVGNAGVLLTQVEYLKHNEEKNFCVVDAAMNDLIRPALYSAWQDIQVVSSQNTEARSYDVVGPVCESADFLGKDRMLAVNEGDVIAVMSSGAYAFVMSSNYNTRARAAEIIVSGTNAYLVRQRETTTELFNNESLLPESV